MATLSGHSIWTQMQQNVGSLLNVKYKPIMNYSKFLTAILNFGVHIRIQQKDCLALNPHYTI